MDQVIVKPPLVIALEISTAPLAAKVGTREYQDAIQAELKRQGWRQWSAPGCAFAEGEPVAVELIFTYPPVASWSAKKIERTRWRTVAPEASELAKLVLSAMAGYLYKKPAQVARLTVEKRVGPACTVIIARSLS
jgi:Holliday junction resolvase RusA-like endonuclease